MAQANGGMSAQELISTVMQLQQAAQDGQQREQQLRAQVENLLKQGNESQQREVQLQAQLNALAQQVQNPGTGQLQTVVGQAFQALAQSQKELVESMKDDAARKVTLIDTKGLGKPEKFDGKEESFLYWRTRLEAFVTGIYPEFEVVMNWAEDEDDEISTSDLNAAFGPLHPQHRTVEGLETINGQFYAVLQSLCDKEAFTIIRSAGRGNGVEAWRKLVRRYDPTTGGRRRLMLRHILNPAKCSKLEDLSSAIENWEESVRIYEARKRADGSRHQLDQEIKTSVLEALCPGELERHLQMNRSRYGSYSDVRNEVMLYLETRLGNRLKVDTGGPMDLSAFSKGKGKGKKGKDGGKKGKGKAGKDSNPGKGKGSGTPSGKETRVCHNCGKTGHLKKDCWSSGGGAANKGQQPKKTNASSSNANAKSQKSGGKGKGVSNLEQAEPEAESAETGYLSIAMLEQWSDDDGDVKMELVDDDENPGMVKVDVKEEPKHIMVKMEDHQCSNPCDTCIHLQCRFPEGLKHHFHECNVCASDRERIEEKADAEGASKQALREDTRWRRPESFHYIVDKTICLVKGLATKVFNDLNDEEKNKLRDLHDPERKSRDGNEKMLKEVESAREDLRLGYFERISEALLKGASRTFSSVQAPGEEGMSRASGSTDLPSRPTGVASGIMMHRTIELLEVSNLDAEKREKYQALEECEDEAEIKEIEARIKEIDERKAVLKEKIREDDKKAKEWKKEGGFKLTSENLLSQEWHDSRYHQAIKAGVSHSKAWADEKKRRKATLHRKSGESERVKEKLDMEEKWHAEFDKQDTVKEEEYHDETAGGIETEAVVEDDNGKIRVLTGKAKQLKRGELRKKDAHKFVKSARTYRKLSQAEVAKFKTETKDDELRVMRKPRVDIHKARTRIMNKDEKLQRSKRVKAARRLKRKTESSGVRGGFYLNHPKDQMRCNDFVRSFCRRGSKCRMIHSEVDREIKFIEKRNEEVEKVTKRTKLVENVGEINSFCTYQPEMDKKGWTKIAVNFDTGAAVTAVPRSLVASGLIESDEKSSKLTYKTASGELLEDEGGVTVKGFDDNGIGKSIAGRLVNVHRMLASGSAVAKKNLVVLDGQGGQIIPTSGKIAVGMRGHLKKLMEMYPDEAARMTELKEQKGIYVFNLWVNGMTEVEDDARELGAVGEESGDFPRQA